MWVRSSPNTISLNMYSMDGPLAVGGREETVSIDPLKPHLGAGPFSAALPAACGHPPASAPVVFQPQHSPAAATMGGPIAEEYSN
jgi:hypothetical protein